MAGNVRTGPRPRRWRVPQHPCSFGNKGLFAERSRGFTLRAERRTEAQEHIFGRHNCDAGSPCRAQCLLAPMKTDRN
jgi:hypothetical protein